MTRRAARPRWPQRLVGCAVLAAALLPARVGRACSSCLSGADGTREAYYGTTLLLIVVPFAALGVLVFWLRRAAQRAERARRASTDPGVPRARPGHDPAFHAG
ncbi:MAG: hypothetical protein JSU66_16175 [Deltaproteobacteria bacterium]|nr:MAG: hypothetical protein JSU66_16175 [Deltaproteobacteria bacterium]